MQVRSNSGVYARGSFDNLLLLRDTMRIPGVFSQNNYLNKTRDIKMKKQGNCQRSIE